MVHLTHHDSKSAPASPTLDHFHRNQWTNSPEYACAPPPHARWFDGRKPGGLDALVFTAGIGENSPEIRAAECSSWVFLGLTLEPDKNANTPGDIEVASDGSAIRVLVVHTQEDWQIAIEYLWLAEYRL